MIRRARDGWRLVSARRAAYRPLRNTTWSMTRMPSDEAILHGVHQLLQFGPR